MPQASEYVYHELESIHLKVVFFSKEEKVSDRGNCPVAVSYRFSSHHSRYCEVWQKNVFEKLIIFRAMLVIDCHYFPLRNAILIDSH